MHSNQIGQNDLAYHLMTEHGPWPKGLSFAFVNTATLQVMHDSLTHKETAPRDSIERTSWLKGRDVGAALADAIRMNGTLDSAFYAGLGFGISEAAGPVHGHHLGAIWNESTKRMRTELVKDT